MSLLTSYLKKESKNLTKKNIKLRIIGRRDRFSLKLNRLIQETEAVTKNGKRTLILALDYGGKWEISEATKKIAHQIKSNQIEPSDITEDLLSKNMCIENFPPPDICIRTGGEKRISNFLLWHMAYTELYFTDCFWPDFDAATFDSAILDYQKRQRRFGKRDEASSGKGNKCAQTAN
jgi:undecaprenyl diphosphate synthase